MLEAGKKVYGILARFETPEALLAAVQKTQSAGYRKFDSHSPFPIHGMDDAMGQKRSPLGFLVGAAALCGLTGMTLFIWWTSAVNYPLVISGKPFFSYQAFVPVIFAVTILFAATTATLGMLALNRLPRLFHPLFSSPQFGRVTDDGFFISIQTTDPLYQPERTTSFLQSVGGQDIEMVYDE
ncbi:MAG TPA: DUF3341 domain-containing protein [Candidatus Deferrimicrobium sp.]|nr:DUF3341 domain-containing protein [Candidatus Deferrimicrobium sp.]